MSGLVRAERLFRARRRARRRRRVRPLVVIAAVTTVVGAGLWVALYSPVLRLTGVTVEGTSRLSAAQVLAAADVPIGHSLVSVSPQAVRERVRRLAAVRDAAVTRQWPHGLLIRVVERTPAAAVATADGVILVDAGGVAFATAPTFPSALLDLHVAGAIPGTGAVDARAAMAVWGELPARLRREVRWVDARSPDAISLGLRTGATVVWGSPGDPAAKTTVLVALMRHRAKVYDVSTPSIAVTSG